MFLRQRGISGMSTSRTFTLNDVDRIRKAKSKQDRKSKRKLEIAKPEKVPPQKNMKLMCLCDSPTLESGFARVAKNLLARWHASGVFEEIWVWGIHFDGFPHGYPYKICPANLVQAPVWSDVRNLDRFINALAEENVGNTPGGFTHLWMMQDTFLLAPIAKTVAQVCGERNIHSLLYFPVDAPLDPEWTSIIRAVDVPVAYCEYGYNQAIKAMRDMPLQTAIRILPHGVDTSVYHRILVEETSSLAKYDIRKEIFAGKVTPTDLLLVNVNQNQKRKGLLQSLLVLKAIRAMSPESNAKLYMHMRSENQHEKVDLADLAAQLGLIEGEEIFFGNKFFSPSAQSALIPESQLNMIYNAADIVLTTSYGEGWGFSITEAMAAGAVVAGPRHTSIENLLSEDRGILFGTLGYEALPWDMSRIRPRTDVDDAAMQILNASEADFIRIAENAQAWTRSEYLSWDAIADKWLSLMGIPQ